MNTTHCSLVIITVPLSKLDKLVSRPTSVSGLPGRGKTQSPLVDMPITFSFLEENDFKIYATVTSKLDFLGLPLRLLWKVYQDKILQWDLYLEWFRNHIIPCWMSCDGCSFVAREETQCFLCSLGPGSLRQDVIWRGTLHLLAEITWGSWPIDAVSLSCSNLAFSLPKLLRCTTSCCVLDTNLFVPLGKIYGFKNMTFKAKF